MAMCIQYKSDKMLVYGLNKLYLFSQRVATYDGKMSRGEEAV